MISIRINENNNDCKVLRLQCLFGAVGSPVATLTWFYSISDLTLRNDFINFGLRPAWLFSMFFILLYILSFFITAIQKHAYRYTCVLYYFAGSAIILATYYYKFSTQSILLMILVSCSFTMVVKKFRQLVYYIGYILTLILIALFSVEHPGVDRLFLLIFFLLYYLLNVGFVRIRTEAQDALRKSEEDYRNLIEITPEAVIVSQDNKIVYFNFAATKLALSSSPCDLKGMPITNFIHPQFLENINPWNDVKLKISDTQYFEQKFTRLDGTEVDVEACILLVKYHGKQALMCIIKDITDRKRAEKEIKHIAYHDALTGLPNRYLLNTNLSDIISNSDLKNQTAAVLFIDLDRFKIVNDTLGHNFGDILLQQVSERLQKCTRKGDIVSRYGGDEFVIILNNFKNGIDNFDKYVSQRIFDEFSKPFHIIDHEIFISPSIGISHFPKDGNNVDTLIKNADAAMYLAKEKGKNNYQFFSSSLYKKTDRNMKLDTGLRKALLNNEFQLLYQPLVDVKTNKITTIEALLHWNHPQLGIISPSEFIPLAEETGLIIPIGEWVLKTACTQNKVWQESGFPSVPITVNISRFQLILSNFIGILRKVLDETGLESNYLNIEIAESVLPEIDSMSTSLSDLKALGLSTSIDHFGTGYSSLNNLKSQSIDHLKIDISLINDIITDTRTKGLIKLIIEMGHYLNLTIIAEGVEHQQQYTLLKSLNCDVIQGYYFCKPLSANDMELHWNKLDT